MTKKILLWSTLVVILLFISAKFPTQMPDAEYIGSETCLECHEEEILKSVIRTPHIAASLQTDETEVESCEACHGPGGAHMEDPEIKGSIRNFADLSSGETTAACLSCHQANHFLKKFKKEKHAQTGESCLSCHSMHPAQPRAKLLSQHPQTLRFSCHQEQVAEFNLPYHHKVEEGRMTCWSCHDPHQTEVSNQRIGYRKINESCYSCHPSQRGPFTYEHLAVNVGTCRSCHKPHGSENGRLLRRSNQMFLCLECHSGPSISDSLFGSKIPSYHITSKATYQNCTICHVKIHGSYLSEYFLR